MVKKNFVRAHLVKGKRWHIDYTLADALTGIESRHRKEFDLNSIPDLQVREEVGIRLAHYLDAFISLADPASTVSRCSISVQDAVCMALDIKLLASRKNTHKGYKYISKSFLAWCNKKKLHTMPLDQFSRMHCRYYVDALQEARKYRAVTINNHILQLQGLWTELYEREHITTNPWKHIKPLREETKIRREFTPEEARLVAQEIEKTDYWLFRALLLQYYCYIRPVEIARLRFRDFNFENYTIRIDSSRAKSHKEMVKTIPQCIFHFFQDERFEKYPANFYVFGYKNGVCEPSQTPLNENRMYKKHRKVLERLHREGILKNLHGLTWYSWKDTGISRHLKKVHPVAARDQASHSELKTTLVYYHADPVNQEYRSLPFDLY